MSSDAPVILSTKDYSIFRTLTSNRGINYNHVKRLQNSMKENPHLFASRPILVNDKMFVIDGQHRLRAAMGNNSLVYYMISPNITVDDTRALNTTQTNWTPIDFAKSYASTGNEHYKAYLQAMAKYPSLSQSVVRYCMSHDRGASSDVQNFKSGMFTVDQPQLSDVYLERLSKIRHYIPNIPMTRSYALAFRELFDKTDVFDFDLFISRLDNENAAKLMRTASTIKEAMRSIEDVYNYNISAKNHVRFY